MVYFFKWEENLRLISFSNYFLFSSFLFLFCLFLYNFHFQLFILHFWTFFQFCFSVKTYLFQTSLSFHIYHILLIDNIRDEFSLTLYLTDFTPNILVSLHFLLLPRLLLFLKLLLHLWIIPLPDFCLEPMTIRPRLPSQMSAK